MRISRLVVLLSMTSILGCSQPPVIGTLEVKNTDAGCWFYQQGDSTPRPLLFYGDYNENIQMNISGKIRQLTLVKPADLNQDKTAKYQAGNIIVILDSGLTLTTKSACGISKRFPEARITVLKNGLSTSIPVKGECGCS